MCFAFRLQYRTLKPPERENESERDEIFHTGTGHRQATVHNQSWESPENKLTHVRSKEPGRSPWSTARKYRSPFPQGRQKEKGDRNSEKMMMKMNRWSSRGEKRRKERRDGEELWEMRRNN